MLVTASIAHPVLAQALAAGRISTHTLAYIGIGVVVVLVLLGLLALFSRTRHTDEVEQFRRVRDMTTAWSEGRPTPRRRLDLSRAREGRESDRDRTG